MFVLGTPGWGSGVVPGQPMPVTSRVLSHSTLKAIPGWWLPVLNLEAHGSDHTVKLVWLPLVLGLG